MKLLCLALIAVSAVAQERQSPPAFLPDVSTSVMKSSATGRAYQISVALPDGYSREHAPYPVLYAADANVQFGTLVETARVFAQIPPLIIVGIGYETRAQGFVWDRAQWISLPRPTRVPPAAVTPRSSLLSSETIWSLRLSGTTTRARIAPGMGIPSERFGLYTLFHNDGLFKRFVIGSPSIWEAKDIIQSSEKAFASSGAAQRKGILFGWIAGAERGRRRHGQRSSRPDSRAGKPAVQGSRLSGALFRGRVALDRDPCNYGPRISIYLL